MLELLTERMQARIRVDDNGCWLWQLRLGKDGYGRYWWKGKTRRAHRVIYEILMGEIPGNLPLDHLCRVPACVNPAHLEPVTIRENNVRAHAACPRKRKTHCDRGHEFTPENTWESVSGGVWRRACRTCGLASNARRTARRQAARAAAALEEART